jgi:hypothetical protein
LLNVIVEVPEPPRIVAVLNPTVSAGVLAGLGALLVKATEPV